MTSLFSSLLWGTSQVDDAVDKATSELLPSGAEDIALNLEICDQIRSKSVQPKDAMRALKRRLNHKNPNVQLLALSLTDTCVKNGGDAFLAEIASREFMDNLVSILKMPALNHDVKNKILRFIQNWAIAFEGKPNLSYAGEVYRTLQREGFNFPPRDPALVNSAMVDTQTAPEWIDSDVCLRCRTAFTFTNRKHHCRNCGQVFDQQCSSKSMALPHFGITQEVRVCDTCYTKLQKKHKSHHRTSRSVSNPRHRSAQDFADAELQRAIQLSLQEVGAAGGHRPGYVPSPSSWQASEPPLIDRNTHPRRAPTVQDDDENDPELKAAIEASLREAQAPRPSAPIAVESPGPEQTSYASSAGYAQSYPPSVATPKPTIPALPNYDLEPLEEDAILTFSQTIEQMQAQGGRDLSRYPAVTELFDKANTLRPKLALSLSDTGRKEEMLTDMHEKLSEAVRLYDKLLTEQLSHPRWRTGPVASTSAQPAYASQNQQAQYSQWSTTPSAHVTSPQLQQATQPPYFTSQSPVQTLQQPTMNGVYVASPPPPPPESYQSMYQPGQPASIPQQPAPEPVQHPQQLQYASPPISAPQYQSPVAASFPVSVPPPPPAAAQVSQQTYQPVQSSPPAASQVQQQQAYEPVQSPPPPAAAQVQQQTYQPVQSPFPPPSSQLHRHNTIAAQSTPPAHASPRTLTRANTMKHTPQQLAQLQQTAVPSGLPNFPSVPSSTPQDYPAYSQQAEPKRDEALLIEL